jgi:hypothetical protein
MHGTLVGGMTVVPGQHAREESVAARHLDEDKERKGEDTCCLSSETNAIQIPTDTTTLHICSTSIFSSRWTGLFQRSIHNPVYDSL